MLWRVAAVLLAPLARPVNAARFRRAVRASEGALRINLGAGDTRLPGWLNTDRNGTALHLDVTRPWGVRRGSVSHVYGDNVIEHFPLGVARRVLRHAHAALRPGGALRLATPDVEQTARLYLSDPRALLERHRRHGYAIDHAVDVLRIVFTTAGHHRGYLWDFASLSYELAAAGFVDVARCAVGESTDPVLRGLEQRTEAAEAATTLVVEARKPAT
jgi:predicted SAM-dependent methyltransferase